MWWGVFHIVFDIVMNESEVFEDLFAILGMFHFEKVLLRWEGWYITGTGINDALIESNIIGSKTLNTVLSGGHYVRSLSGMLIVADVLDSLMCKAFLNSNQDEDILRLTTVDIDVKDALISKSRERSKPKRQELVENADVLCAEVRALSLFT